MKQGLVTKIEKKFMIIKTDDADIERLKIRKNIQIGERISYEKRDIYKGFNRISYNQIGTSLSMFIIVALVGFYLVGQLNENKVYGVVSYDINPSLLIEINEDEKVLNVNSKDGFDHIIPADYKKQALDSVLNEITENAIKENLLGNDETILLSYVNVSDEEKPSEALRNFIDTHKDTYQIILITSNETYLKGANDNNQTVSRKYLLESLNANNMQVEDSNQYIQDVVKILDIYKETEKGFVEINTDTLIKVDTSEVKSSDDKTDSTAIKNDDDTTGDTNEESSDNIDESSTEDEDLTEEDDVQSEEELKAIEAQKIVTDEAYKDYLNKKAASDTAKENFDQQQTLVDEKTEQLQTQNSRYTDIIDEEKELVLAKNTLENRITTDKAESLDDAASTKDATIKTTSSDQITVDSKITEGDQIYNEAYDVYKPIADRTIIYLEPIMNNRQELLDSPPLTVGINIDALQAEVAELDQMMSTVANKNGILTPEVTLQLVDIEMIMAYNDAYIEFNSERQKKNTLYSQANKLQKEIDAVIAQANTDYENSVKEINDLYSADSVRIADIQIVLDGFNNVKPKFETNIKEMSDVLALLEDDLIRLTTLYNQAIRSKENAYNIYVKEKELLDQLENKE